MTKQLPSADLTDHLQWNPLKITHTGNVMKAILNSGLYKTRDDSLLQMNYDLSQDMNNFDYIDLETNALFAIALVKTGNRALARKVMESIDDKLQTPKRLPRNYYNNKMGDMQVDINGRSCCLWALAQRAVYGRVPDKTLELIRDNLSVGPVLSAYTFPPNIMPHIDIFSSSLWAMMRSPAEAKKTVDMLMQICNSEFTDGMAFHRKPERTYISTETNAYWVMALCAAGEREKALRVVEGIHTYSERDNPTGVMQGSFTLLGITHTHDKYISAKENALWALALQAAGKQDEAAKLLDGLDKSGLKLIYGLMRVPQARTDKEAVRGDDNCLYAIALAGAGL